MEIIESIMLCGYALAYLALTYLVCAWVYDSWRAQYHSKVGLYCGRCEVRDGSAPWELGESHASYCWVLYLESF